MLCVAACSGGPPIAREPDEYVGCATDENWQTFDTTPDTVSDAQSPLITAPGANATVSGSVPPTWRWQVSPTVVGSPAGNVPMTCAQWNEGFTELHLPPITGCVYDLQISYDGAVQHRALTTLQQWTASAEVWQKTAGHEISLVLRRMTLVDNEPQAGPYEPTAPTGYSVSSN
jgi:hypothetical protein